MSLIERKAVKHLLKVVRSSIIELDRKMSFADRLLKRRRLSLQSSGSEYLDTRFIVETLNISETAFQCCRLRNEQSPQRHAAIELRVAAVHTHEIRSLGY